MNAPILEEFKKLSVTLVTTMERQLLGSVRRASSEAGIKRLCSGPAPRLRLIVGDTF
jgi:hypothetical protein